MSNFSFIPLGYKIPSQIPLDAKTYIQNEDLLKDLGTGNQLAFTYYRGLIVTCIDENTQYVWKEVTPQNDGTGLITTNFQYPSNHIVFGIDYSDKEYNFFPKVDLQVDGSETKIVAGTNSTVTGNGTTATPYTVNFSGITSINDATSSVKGILRLTGDLGGTADTPTTPTALHITNAETFSGFKSATNTSTTPAGIILTNNNSTFSPVLSVTTNNTSEPGVRFITNSIGAAQNINMSGNNINAVGIDILSTTTGNATSFPIRYSNGVSGIYSYLKKDGEFMANSFKNRLDSFLVSSVGNVIANSYIKTGGTLTQMLMADGSVKENQDNLQRVITASGSIQATDNNRTIFINNGSGNITLSVPTGLPDNFNCGFIQQGTGEVLFIATGTTINTPIGLKIKGQNYNAYLEKVENTEVYHLLGNLKV